MTLVYMHVSHPYVNDVIVLWGGLMFFFLPALPGMVILKSKTWLNRNLAVEPPKYYVML